MKLCYKPCLIIYHINGTGEKLDKVEAVDIDTQKISILPTDRFLNGTYKNEMWSCFIEYVFLLNWCIVKVELDPRE